MLIDNLKVGQRVKNYKELCSILNVPVLKAIGAKYCENIQDPQEKEIMNDILNNGDPNGLVLLIQKLKKNITHLEIGGRVLEKKKKDYYRNNN